MKILMLGWELPPHNSGGLGVACYNLARALARDDVEIDFIVPYTAEHPGSDFMKIVPASSIDPLFRYGNGSYESLNIDGPVIPNKDTAYSIRDIQKLYGDFVEQYIEENRPDVLHAHDWLTFEAGLRAKRKYHLPLICHVHATEYDRSGMNEGNPIIHKIEQEGLENADKIVAVSELTKNLIHTKYHIPFSKIEVLHNTLDEAYNERFIFNQEQYNYIKTLKEDGYTIVSTVGRFTIQKGLTFLFSAAKRALSKNPKLFFIFAGDGEERNELIKLAADLGIAEKVIFTGFIRGQKLRDIYALSDVFVMSSVSEPFGLTALEAAAHDNALILTKQSGASEVITSAFKYDYWDDEKLAKQIVALSKSQALKTILEKNSKEEYNSITWNNIAEKCLEVYHEAENKIQQ